MGADRDRGERHQSRDPLKGLTVEEVGHYVLDEGRLTSPDTIDDNVIVFCKALAPGHDPIFLKPNPQPWSRYLYCDKNIEHIIKFHGGSIEFGYRIWYVPDLYIEAEPHAIWNKPDGNRMDISFYPGGEERVLFLPDPTLHTVSMADHKKPRKALHTQVKPVIDFLKDRELKNPSVKDTSWDGWRSAPSYEDWQRSKRTQF